MDALIIYEDAFRFLKVVALERRDLYTAIVATAGNITRILNNRFPHPHSLDIFVMGEVVLFGLFPPDKKAVMFY
jgi:hypothetical protein